MAASEIDDDVIRRIRNQVPDNDAVFGANNDEYMFSDDDITDFYSDATELFPGSSTAAGILRAAAYANLAIATSEAIISKNIRTQDLQTNGATIATAVTARAQVLFDQADKVDAQSDSYFFTIVDYPLGTERPELTEYYETF